MIKSIHYAYPSSPSAIRFNRSRVGCYLVAVERGGPRASNLSLKLTGPYDSLEVAESVAECLAGDWWELYLKFPLPGSRFTNA